MSKQSRQELLEITRIEYQKTSWKERKLLLDSFSRTTGHNRKYAIKLLNQKRLKIAKARTRKPIYDDACVEALKQIWIAANRVASKRLIPFIPVLLPKLEEYGHLVVSTETRNKLLQLSAATADRLLRDEKKKQGRQRGMTRPGRLLKKHVEVRTFADWNDTTPGFFEADLVSHCGGVASGLFLNTLTMTDIASGWIEMVPVSGKSENEVLRAICKVASELPFPMEGLDTDNGFEFINFGTIEWCEKQGITFTRAREYKKNDQAHVEEKNGSVVRRLIGYDRFEGAHALKKMYDLYKVARVYINFFQPSMKLLQKERDGARVKKRHDVAQTPYQRLMSSGIQDVVKQRLTRQFEKLDPVMLLQALERCQLDLWATATHANPAKIAPESLAMVLSKVSGAADIDEVLLRAREHRAGLQARLRIKTTDQSSLKPSDSPTEEMRRFILGLPPGHKLFPDELSAFGSPLLANQLLANMMRHGDVVREKRGQYRIPGEPKNPPNKPLVTGKPTADMRTYILSLPSGQLFRYEELLQFGSKGVANQLLRNLQKKNVVLHVQRSCYRTNSLNE